MSTCVHLATLLVAALLVGAHANYDLGYGTSGSYDPVGQDNLDNWGAGVPSGDISCSPSNYGGQGSIEFTGAPFPVRGSYGPPAIRCGPSFNPGSFSYGPGCGSSFPCCNSQCGPWQDYSKDSKKSKDDGCKGCYSPKNIAFKLTGFKEQTFIPLEVLGKGIPVNWDCMPKPCSPCCPSCDAKEDKKSTKNDKKVLSKGRKD